MDCKDEEHCPRNTKLLERLTTLEVSIEQNFKRIDSNVALARDIVEKDRTETRDLLEAKFEAFNQWQRRFDRLEGELVKKSELEKEVVVARQFTDQALSTARDVTTVAERNIKTTLEGIHHRMNSIERLVYIGVGLTLAVQFGFHYFK